MNFIMKPQGPLISRLLIKNVGVVIKTIFIFWLNLIVYLANKFLVFRIDGYMIFTHLQNCESKLRLPLGGLSGLREEKYFRIGWVYEKFPALMSAAVQNGTLFNEQIIQAVDWKCEICIRFSSLWCEFNIVNREAVELNVRKLFRWNTRRFYHLADLL